LNLNKEFKSVIRKLHNKVETLWFEGRGADIQRGFIKCGEVFDKMRIVSFYGRRSFVGSERVKEEIGGVMRNCILMAFLTSSFDLTSLEYSSNTGCLWQQPRIGRS